MFGLCMVPMAYGGSKFSVDSSNTQVVKKKNTNKYTFADSKNILFIHFMNIKFMNICILI